MKRMQMVMGAALGAVTASAVVSGCSAETTDEPSGEVVQSEANLDNAK